MTTTKHYGVTLFTAEAYGTFTGASKGDGVERAKAENEVGRVTDDAAVTRLYRASGTFVLKGAPPKSGTLATVDGMSMMITDIEVTEESRGFAMGTISFERDDEATQTAYVVAAT